MIPISDCHLFLGTLNNKIAHKNLTTQESHDISTGRELYSIWYSLNAFVKSLKSKSVGSKKENLQKLTIDIIKFCEKENISLKILWIPKELNLEADFTSKYSDNDDWSISCEIFNYLNSI